MKFLTRRKISIIKNGFRAVAYGSVMASTSSFFVFKVFLVLLIAELIGIIGEFFE